MCAGGGTEEKKSKYFKMVTNFCHKYAYILQSSVMLVQQIGSPLFSVCSVGGSCERRTPCSCDRSGRGGGSPEGSTESPVYQTAASRTPAQEIQKEKQPVLEMITVTHH